MQLACHRVTPLDHVSSLSLAKNAMHSPSSSYTRRISSSPPADCNDRRSSEIPKRNTGARDATFPRSARNNWIPKRDGYIHSYIQTISEMRRRISCLALRRSTTKSGLVAIGLMA